MLSGSLHEIRYEWPNADKSNKSDATQEMKVLDENHMKTNDVAYINGKNRLLNYY